MLDNNFGIYQSLNNFCRTFALDLKLYQDFRLPKFLKYMALNVVLYSKYVCNKRSIHRYTFVCRAILEIIYLS